MAVYGVCIGSVSASIAACKSGKVEVLANDFGERITPVLVAYRDKEKVIGHSAKQALHRSASSTAALMTLLLTHELNDPSIQDVLKQIPCQVVEREGVTCYEIPLENKQLLHVPVRAALVDVFRKLYETAKSFDRASDSRAVIGVSSDFSEEHKRTLSECASEAGFTVMRVISQASACCLQYNFGQKDKNSSKMVLVYSLGHCGLELSLLSVEGGMFRTLASHTDYSCGGRGFDDAITQLLLSEFQRQWKCDVSGNARALHKLRAAVEGAKHTLATNQTASVHVESLHEGIDFQYTLTRGRFDGVCSAIFRSCINPVLHFLNSANVTKNQLDHVVLAGGSCKMPRLQQLLAEAVAPTEVLGSIAPDEVVVLGAASQAGLMGRWEAGEGGEEEEEELVPCTPHDLWIVCAGMESVPAVKLLPGHVPIPCTRTATIELPPPIPDQDSVCIEFREGLNNTVATVTVPMATQSSSKLEVELHWKKDNTVSIATKLDPGNWLSHFDLECQ